jgi:hypothetical protein
MNSSINTKNRSFDNLIDIASVIQEAIIEYQKNNPDDLSVSGPAKYAMYEVMKFSRGHVNPELMVQMIRLERSVYKPGTIMQC